MVLSTLPTGADLVSTAFVKISTVAYRIGVRFFWYTYAFNLQDEHRSSDHLMPHKMGPVLAA